MRTKGTILAAYPAPELALDEGKYKVVSREGRRLASDAARVVGPLLAKPRELIRTPS
jgi:hypothetical protein